MFHNRLSRIVIASAVVMAGGIALAQVTVNAPKGLLNRGSAQQETPKPQNEPASSGAQNTVERTGGESSQLQVDANDAPTEEASVAPASDGKPHQVSLTPQDIDDFSFSSQVIVGTAAGYRVQVFFSSRRDASNDACERARQIALAFPHYRDYISYNAPQWRLRVGDFVRQAEAERAMRRILRQFPDFRGEVAVVSDHINLWH